MAPAAGPPPLPSSHHHRPPGLPDRLRRSSLTVPPFFVAAFVFSSNLPATPPTPPDPIRHASSPHFALHLTAIYISLARAEHVMCVPAARRWCSWEARVGGCGGLSRTRGHRYQSFKTPLLLLFCRPRISGKLQGWDAVQLHEKLVAIIISQIQLERLTGQAKAHWSHTQQHQLTEMSLLCGFNFSAAFSFCFMF